MVESDKCCNREEGRCKLNASAEVGIYEADSGDRCLTSGDTKG